MNSRIQEHKKRSSVRFTQAPEWNQEIALSRVDLLEKGEEFVKIHKAEIGVTKSRKRFLRLYNEGKICQDIKEKLRGRKIKLRTYYRLLKDFTSFGLDGLLEKYNNGGCRIAPEIREAIERMIWENHLCRYQDIHEDLQVLFPKSDLYSYSTIRKYAKGYKAKNWAALVFKHEGQKGLRDRNMELALGRKDEDLTEPNQRWEIDTTITDLFTHPKIIDVVLITKDGKRCKTIGTMDVFSRLPKFYLVEEEKSLIVGRIIRDRIRVWGKPDEIIIDNGRPYLNNRVLNFLRSIGVTCHICIPGNPVEKPHIERAFRTLSEKLLRRLCGYSGNSVQTKPNEIEIKHTMEEAQEIIDRYFTNVYAETIHRSTGQRPRERLRLPGFIPKTIPERELDILLMEEYERKVRQGHITYQGGKYFHPKLPEGQTVKVRVNDFAASELLVFVDRKFLCVAEDLSRKGKTPKEIQDAKKERNRELKTRIRAHEALINKQKPKDANILSLIDYHEEIKPIELPKKAEVLEFPELKNIHYTRPEIEEQDSKEPQQDIGNKQEQRLIRNKREKYLDVRRRQRTGEVLDSFDKRFLEEFLTSNEYRMIGTHLEEQLKMEMANEG